MQILNWSKAYKFNKENYETILKEEFFDKMGVYMWVYKDNKKGYFVHYIGQTKRSFRERLKEHFKAALSGKCYIYDMESNKNLTNEITRIAHKGNFEKEAYEEKYGTLSDAGEKYISSLEFLFAPLEINDIDVGESYLINKVIENEKESYKLFLINDVIPSNWNIEFENAFTENIVVNF